MSSLFTRVVISPLPLTIIPSPFFWSAASFERNVSNNNFHHTFILMIFFPYQSGFRTSHLTQSLIFYCLDKWYKALDKQHVGVVFLDISKAFGHNICLAKLSQLRFSPSTVGWFQSYLSNHSQVTCVADSFSSLGFPYSGIPQGSIFGPTFFSAFIM